MRTLTITLILCALLGMQPLATAQWTPDPYDGMVMVCDEPDQQAFIKVLGLQGGNTIIGWNNNANTFNPKIHYQVLDIQGRALLPEGGVPLIISDTATVWTFSGLLPDGQGGCIAVFEDFRNGIRQIYGQRIDAMGNRLWGYYGLPLAIWPEFELTSNDIACDSLGNFFVCYVMEPNQNDSHLYAQKFDVDGNRLWGPYGVPFCTFSGWSNWPEAVPDGDGGILIAWEQDRGVAGDDSKFYFQHLDADGNALLPENGIEVLLTNQSPVWSLEGVTDSEGGGIWAWESHGWFNTIHAFRLSGDGRTIWEWDSIIYCAHGYYDMISHPADGNVWLAIEDNRTGEYIPYLYCFTPDGTPLFGDEGLPFGGMIVPTTGGVITMYSYLCAHANVLSVQFVNNDGSPGWKTTSAQYDSSDLVFTGYAGTFDGYDGAVVAFGDGRNFQTNNYDVAAQRICWDGSLAQTIYAPPFQQRNLDAELILIGNTLHYTLPQAGAVTLELYDILGRRVNILEQGNLSSGNHVVHLSVQNLPSGIYFARLSTPSHAQTLKIVLFR